MPTLTCPACGIQYWRAKAQIACSRACGGWLHRGIAGQTEQICKQCKGSFHDQEIRPFCKQACYWEWKKGKYTEALQNATFIGGFKSTLKAHRNICKYCKKIYRILGNRKNKNMYYCSQTCYMGYMRKYKTYYKAGLEYSNTRRKKQLYIKTTKEVQDLIEAMNTTITKASKIIADKYSMNYMNIRSRYYAHRIK